MSENQTLDLTPTWEQIMPSMIHLLTQSNLDAEALQIIKDNLMNCAKAADLHTHSVKERARQNDEAKRQLVWMTAEVASQSEGE